MKKTFLCLIVFTLASAMLFASFDGRTSVGLNYGYLNGTNSFGLTTDTVGYANSCPVGYYIVLDTGFDITDFSSCNINMIFAPSYRYKLDSVPMYIEVALGASASCNDFSIFSFGVGGYIGASYSFSELCDVVLGIKMGSNFASTPLDKADFSVSCDFYAIPMLSIGFKY